MTGRGRWLAGVLAAAAVASSLWSGVRIWTTPVRYEVVDATGDGAGANRRFEARPFAEVSALGAVPLAVPVLISGLGAWAALRGRRWVLASAVLALALFTLLGSFSIGWSYLPALSCLVLAAGVGTVVRRPPRLARL